jgi:hypothetical protein
MFAPIKSGSPVSDRIPKTVDGQEATLRLSRTVIGRRIDIDGPIVNLSDVNIVADNANGRRGAEPIEILVLERTCLSCSCKHFGRKKNL